MTPEPGNIEGKCGGDILGAVWSEPSDTPALGCSLLGRGIAVALPVVRLLPLVVLLFLRWLPG